jgi:succinate dehydrogenase/fumarate reductase flavoprotein subunit
VITVSVSSRNSIVSVYASCPADPERRPVKKALHRQLRRARVLIPNRYMATRPLTATDGRVAGAIAVGTRNADFLVIRAKAIIVCMGAAGFRLRVRHL